MIPKMVKTVKEIKRRTPSTIKWKFSFQTKPIRILPTTGNNYLPKIRNGEIAKEIYGSPNQKRMIQ